MLNYERRLWRAGVVRIAGVDEAGRGALAGPVVACAAVFSPNAASKLIKKVRDSKKLTELARERLYEDIVSAADAWDVGIVSHRLIDRINVVNASLYAMHIAVQKLAIAPQRLLLDGYFSAKALNRKFGTVTTPPECIVHGDAHVFSIAAASVIAKVTRDRLMRALHQKYPQYGLGEHKGYGTVFHYKMLRLYGPSAVHRASYYLG
ncbi:MAG: ribonuclease HII [bacterium]|nr:ribonuclease HII [bacterium]